MLRRVHSLRSQLEINQPLSSPVFLLNPFPYLGSTIKRSIFLLCFSLHNKLYLCVCQSERRRRRSEGRGRRRGGREGRRERIREKAAENRRRKGRRGEGGQGRRNKMEGSKEGRRGRKWEGKGATREL